MDNDELFFVISRDAKRIRLLFLIALALAILAFFI